MRCDGGFPPLRQAPAHRRWLLCPRFPARSPGFPLKPGRDSSCSDRVLGLKILLTVVGSMALAGQAHEGEPGQGRLEWEFFD